MANEKRLIDASPDDCIKKTNCGAKMDGGNKDA